MEGTEVLMKLVDKYPEAYFVSTCGYTTRDLFNIHDSPRNFYMVGAMGIAAAIGLGVALSCKSKKVIIIDGDGSLLMNIGIMTMIVQQNLPNLIHIVLDNGVHESTGGQKTVSIHNFSQIAEAIGYKSNYTINDISEFDQIPSQTKKLTFIHCLVNRRKNSIGKRVAHEPEDIVLRFKNQITK